MANMVNMAEQQLRTAVANAVAKAQAVGTLPAGDLPAFAVEVPNDRAHGDFAVNAAMVSARVFSMAPRKIAEAILENIVLDETVLERAEVAGPGFLNFFLSNRYYADTVSAVLAEGAAYGRTDFGAGQKVMVEFVSANPTGPMHLGNARGGALGDCLAAVLDAAGYDVWREFYINDAGNQIEKFATSLDCRYRQMYLGVDAVAFPEDAYQGDDIKERAAEFAAVHGDSYMDKAEADRRKALVDFALPLNIERMQNDMAKYRIVYDEWFKESVLHASGEVQEIIDILTDRGLTYEKDGATWYKASEMGAEKDEVLIRANGTPTYFAADIAYHRNKFKRGFDRLIDVWGADHHGHVARMKGALNAIGEKGDNFEVVLMQLVRLMRDGEVVRMSKRSGKAIQLADLLDEVPVDAARFFFNLRESTSQVDFDLDLAIEQSSSNPVYYVQYAHARICSIFRNLEADGIKLGDVDADILAKLGTAEEKELIRHIAAYPEEIIGAAKASDPARMTRYSMELATLFHKFYNACRVKGDDAALTQARLALCAAVRTTLRNVLALLKIDAPETM